MIGRKLYSSRHLPLCQWTVITRSCFWSCVIVCCYLFEISKSELMESRDKAAVWIVGIITFGIVLINFFFALETASTNNGFESFYFLATPIVTAAAAGGAIYYALKVRDGNLLIQDQVQIAREGQLAERYAKAAEMLSSGQRGELREAGILLLKALVVSDQSGNYYFPAQDLLCTFIRSRSRSLSNQKSVSSSLKAAIRTFSFLRTEIGLKHEKANEWRPQLGDANFRKFTEQRIAINFKNADLFNSNFMLSRFKAANFENANLSGANLAGSRFTQSNFAGAKLTDTNLESVVVDQATLETIDLDERKWTASFKGDHFRIEHAQPKQASE
ncbi:pentapeptide repeat-containing protein [Cohaesibacter celericrescens]|uniref:Pentapeptide repeat-containing protein n=1 Tax=Cohaesibacter celericrescens TaxID=2067669 RepID=A0A2N5XQN4_9HYPH|nr:pentapeptide repeat-containing protein [Cohaesibacter celericrescens]PLW76819.1 hypothetical protein C0081_12220 [Cohaesibacter celericrescens]